MKTPGKGGWPLKERRPPHHSKEGVGGVGGVERLIRLCGVYCVQGALGYTELDVCPVCVSFLVGYNEISFHFLIQCLLTLTHLFSPASFPCEGQW